MLRRWFLDHPRSVGESYFGHQRAAFGFAFRLFGAACACFIHGLVPKFFERTGSRTVAALHDDMIVHRAAKTAESAAHPAAAGSHPRRAGIGL